VVRAEERARWRRRGTVLLAAAADAVNVRAGGSHEDSQPVEARVDADVPVGARPSRRNIPRVDPAAGVRDRRGRTSAPAKGSAVTAMGSPAGPSGGAVADAETVRVVDRPVAPTERARQQEGSCRWTSIIVTHSFHAGSAQPSSRLPGGGGPRSTGVRLIPGPAAAVTEGRPRSAGRRPDPLTATPGPRPPAAQLVAARPSAEASSASTVTGGSSSSPCRPVGADLRPDPGRRADRPPPRTNRCRFPPRGPSQGGHIRTPGTHGRVSGRSGQVQRPATVANAGSSATRYRCPSAPP